MPSKTSAPKKTALVAYVPALHAGYISFLEKHKGVDIFLLGKTLVSLTPRMERDIRALTALQAKSAIEGLGLEVPVSILEAKTLKKKLEPYRSFILPDEDVSRNFAEKFLKRRKVSFERVFLRWDKTISTVEFQIAPDRVISTKQKDLKILREAGKEATKSGDWWRQIGAVLMKGKRIQVRAYNRHFPSDSSVGIMGDPRSNFDYGEQPEVYTSIHAEADVVAQAAAAGISLRGAELFVTTFPCPNCARLIARAGVKRVFYALGYSKLDAEQILKSAGVEIILVTSSA